jgi:hypothetical protein
MATATVEAPAKAKPKATSRKKYDMSEEHKASLAAGREQSRLVREYLVALSESRPKRGRKRTIESVQKRLEQVNTALQSEDDPLKRLALISERETLEVEVNHFSGETLDVTELEKRFIEVAKAFSERKGVSYNAWREAGVPPHVLKAAGITRAA